MSTLWWLSRQCTACQTEIEENRAVREQKRAEQVSRTHKKDIHTPREREREQREKGRRAEKRTNFANRSGVEQNTIIYISIYIYTSIYGDVYREREREKEKERERKRKREKQRERDRTILRDCKLRSPKAGCHEQM